MSSNTDRRVIDTISELAGVATKAQLPETNVYSDGEYDDPAWITSLAGDKVAGDIAGNAATSSSSKKVAGTTFDANDNTDIRLIDAPCTTAGKGAMGMSVAGVPFGGVGDPLTAYGYNLRANGGAIDTSEVAWGLKFEGDYLEEATGKRLCEHYIEFWPIGSATAIRPYFIRMDRTATDPLLSLDTALFLGNPFQIALPDGTATAEFGLGGATVFASDTTADNSLKIQAPAGHGAGVHLQYDGVDNAGVMFTEATSYTLQSINGFQLTAAEGFNVTANVSGVGAFVSTGPIQVRTGTADARIRHVGGGNVLMQIGPANSTTISTTVGMGAVNSALGSAVQTKADGSIVFLVTGGGTIASISATGALTAASYKVGANQVVGAQGAAVADATDAASVITQLNALLARLRAHGLIAT